MGKACVFQIDRTGLASVLIHVNDGFVPQNEVVSAFGSKLRVVLEPLRGGVPVLLQRRGPRIEPARLQPS